MALPRGRIVHATDERVRIRFPSRKDDPDFFQALEKPLKEHPAIKSVQTNSVTASLLLAGDLSDPAKLAAYAEQQGLFRLDSAAAVRGVPLRQKVYQSFDAGNRFVRAKTRNEFDLPVVIFLALIGSGIYQLLRSEVRLPPWYTAFWYALGVFTKSLSDLDAGDDGGE
jgi:hypothetical protein